MNKYYSEKEIPSIDIDAVNQELAELEKTKSMLMNHYSIPEDKWLIVEKEATNQIKEYIKRETSISEKINTAMEVDRGCCGYRIMSQWDISELSPKLSLKSINKSIANYCDAICSRKAALLMLRDHLSKVDTWAVRCSDAAVKAGRLFNSIKTHTGYHIDINFTHELPPGTIDYIHENVSHNGYIRYTNTVNFGIDGNWFTNVVENGIERVDIAGKEVMTTWAEEIPEHELLDEGVKLFKATVAVTQMKRDYSSWSLTPEQVENVIRLEEKVIAIQQLTSEPDIITTGKDISWAVRTMKGRMKKKMYDMMDLI